MANVSRTGAWTRSQIENSQTEHLRTAASSWTSDAHEWENHFEHIHRGTLSPGGTPWEGTAADAAQDGTFADLVKVRGMADHLHSAATAARNGADDIAWAKRQTLDAIAQAQEAGFTVGEDLSVTDHSSLLPAGARAARQAQAEAFAADIHASAENLATIDKAVANQVSTALAPLGNTSFDDSHDAPTVQAVDYKTAPAPDPPEPGPPQPARGLPPADIRPPVDGPLTEGPASRARERRFGGRSLWDEHGGEWRYYPGDDHHNPHWDFNPHSTPSGRGSDWENIPIDGLPPRIGENPAIISGLPPWLQDGAIQNAPIPAQNPLLAPFPGTVMPAAPPPAAPAAGPSLMPHIDISPPNSGELQTAGGQATVAVGGGSLLLTLLGAMALG